MQLQFIELVPSFTRRYAGQHCIRKLIIRNLPGAGIKEYLRIETLRNHS